MSEKTPGKPKKRNSVKQLRDIHLEDKTHVVTDEEIRNLDLDLGHPSTIDSHTPELPDDKDRPKDEDKDPKIITPWDVIK